MNTENDLFKHKELTEKIIGCFYDVYNELGFGFLECVYHESMVLLLRERGLIVESRVKIPVRFRGVQVGLFEADVFVERKVVWN